MPEEEVLASGIWCEQCEFFEEIIVIDGDARCPSCGCRLGKHIKVKVVKEQDDG